MAGEQTLDLPSPSATAWDFIAFQGPLKRCTLGPLTPAPHCWLGPWVSLSCPSVYSQSTGLFGCFSHISAERSVFNKTFSRSVKSLLKLIFVFLSREWFPGVLNCILLSIKIWLIPNTVLLPKWPLCLHSCLSVKKIDFLADFIYFTYFLLCSICHIILSANKEISKYFYLKVCIQKITCHIT